MLVKTVIWYIDGKKRAQSYWWLVNFQRTRQSQ